MYYQSDTACISLELETMHGQQYEPLPHRHTHNKNRYEITHMITYEVG